MISMDLIHRARDVLPGSPLAQTAADICYLRGIDPFGYDPMCPIIGFARWQVVVAEMMLIHMAIPQR